MKLKLKRQTTSKIVRIFVQDTTRTDGGGLTGLTNSAANLVCYYLREGDTAPTALALSGGTVGTWSSGGFREVDAAAMPGVYELGVPNAALASGNSVVMILRGAANMAPVLLEIELDAVDYQDPIRHGATALPSAVFASGAGALPGTDASGAVVLSAADSPVLHRGTATAAGAANISLQGTASGTPQLYRGCEIKIIGGAGAGQTRHITDYAGVTPLLATVDSPWTAVPDATSQYVVLYGYWPSVNAAQQVGSIVAAFASGKDVVSQLRAATINATPTAGTLDEVWTAQRNDLMPNLLETPSQNKIDIFNPDNSPFGTIHFDNIAAPLIITFTRAS